jgi:16S rRNA (cytosine967-C5)-methyltransferase
MRQPHLPAGNTPHRVGITEALADGRVQRAALRLYQAAAADWSRAPNTLAHGFREARELHSRERRFVGEAVYGMIRWRRRLEQVTGDAAPASLYRAWVEWELGGATHSFDSIDDPMVRLAIEESYPDWIVRTLVDELGLDEAARLCGAMNRRAPLTARANRLKNTRDQLAEILQEEGVASQPSPLAPDGLTLETHVNAYGLRAFKEGRFELQDAASQLVAELVAPPPRGVVVDACAGAGGKTLALGALMQNRGRLVALDVAKKKLEELRKRARRAGLTNVQALLAEEAPQVAADRVLVDAPCSGLGVLRRNPEARWRLSPEDLIELPKLQREILERYLPLVAPGGRIIYATCTVARAENDAVFDAFLAAHPELEPVPAKEILGGERARGIGDGTRLRMMPHQHDTDGFFAAVARRRS